MSITAQQRLNVEWLMNEYLPFNRGDRKYEEVCRGYGRKGTTCGYLAHWLLWRLGCKNPDLVNRPEVASMFIDFDAHGRPHDHKVKVAGNVSMINEYRGTRRSPMVVSPEPGDIMIIDNLVYAAAKRGTDQEYLKQHVIVFLAEEAGANGRVWRTAEAGKAKASAPNGVIEASLGTRKVIDTMGRVTLEQGGEPEGRAVIAWLPLDTVVFSDPPMALKYT
jgi:hypothetical protein